MEIFNVEWPTKYAASSAQLDCTYQKVFNAEIILNEYFSIQNREEAEVLALIKEINMVILEHMDFEIQMLQIAGIEGWRRHRLAHMAFKEKYDMCFKHEISDKMRIIISAKMLKVFINKHIVDFDVPDVEKLNIALEEEDEEMAS